MTTTVANSFANFIAPPAEMTLSEKLAALQQIADAPSYAKFCEMVDVNSVTLKRAEANGTATERVYERIVGAFQGLTVEHLRNPDLALPEDIQPVHRTTRADELHEGRKLERYLKRHNIKQIDLAAQMDVSRVQIHSYLKTARFRPEQCKNILKALNASAAEVFGVASVRGAGAEKPTGVSLLALPLIRPRLRDTTLEALNRFVDGYVSSLMPEITAWVNPELMGASPQDLSEAVVVEVTESDHMAPSLRPGAQVVCVLLDPARWNILTDSAIMMLVDGQLVIRQVYRNDLRTNNLLEVGPFDRSQGGASTLRRGDISAIYQVTSIVYSPA